METHRHGWVRAPEVDDEAEDARLTRERRRQDEEDDSSGELWAAAVEAESADRVTDEELDASLSEARMMERLDRLEAEARAMGVPLRIPNGPLSRADRVSMRRTYKLIQQQIEDHRRRGSDAARSSPGGAHDE